MEIETVSPDDERIAKAKFVTLAFTEACEVTEIGTKMELNIIALLATLCLEKCAVPGKWDAAVDDFCSAIRQRVFLKS